MTGWNEETVRQARTASQTKADRVTAKGVLAATGVFIVGLFAATFVWSLVAVLLLGLTFEQEQAAGPFMALAGAIGLTVLWVRWRRGVRRAAR